LKVKEGIMLTSIILGVITALLIQAIDDFKELTGDK
jgi:hypothetical protein